MPDNVFVDSNIFIYAKVKSQDPTKHLCAKNFLRTLDEQVFISVQVLNEFYNTLVRIGIDDHTIQNSLKDIMQSTQTQSISKSTVQRCWKLRIKNKYSYYDSLILASAIESECKTLYTEDMQHEQVIDGKLKILNPFL
ncbi:MAG: PIN domain-containing protein [Desulfatirhabdiaceae bacterium]